MIQRAIREVVYERLRSEIVRGSFEPGTPLRDSDLAQDLGVSRTPIREALLRLNRDGLLDLSHNRGFRVPVLDERVARETYQILWALEVDALRASAPGIARVLPVLRLLNAQFAREGQTPEKQLEADEKWHRALVSPSGNARLLALLDVQKQVVKRYELWFMRDARRIEKSSQEHADILACLARHAMGDACDRLETHWRGGLEILLQEMERR